MKLLIWPFLLISHLSCTSVKKDEKILAWEEWKGRRVSALERHPYFKNLPITKMKHENGRETWLLRDQSRFQTDAYCQALGGCIGLPNYNCDNAFSVEDGIIVTFEQSGSCPGVKTIEVLKK
jgi:hypothetical protein